MNMLPPLYIADHRSTPLVGLGSSNAEFKIGYLYGQKDSSWVTESFSQFRLAVKRINAQPPSASFPKLTFVAYDSGRTDSDRSAGSRCLMRHSQVATG